MNRFIIVGSGNKPDKILKNEINPEDRIIAVDGGYNFLRDLDLEADFLLGDFDSIKGKIEANKEMTIIRYPKEKAATDMELAYELAIENGANQVRIFGATGTRYDHSLVNILLLIKFKELNIKAEIIDENNIISIIYGKNTVKKDNYKYLSFIILEEGTILNLKGVKYPLVDKKLDYPSSLTISNEITDKKAYINTNKKIIMIRSKD